MRRFLFSTAMLGLAFIMKAVAPQTYDFAVVDGDTLRMDVYMPGTAASSPRPVVLFAFGGGFTHGSRNNPEYKEFFEFLSENGVVAISTDYRTTLARKATPQQLTSTDGFTSALRTAVTDAVTDYYTATGFVLSHAAEWGIDPTKIIASGSSAGAITALQAEYGLVNGAIPSGLFPEWFNYAATVTFAGAICGEDSLVWKRTPCPMMLFHGDADRNVPYSTLTAGHIGLWGSRAIAISLADHEVPFEFFTFAGADHSIAVSPMHDQLYTILGFILRISEGKQNTSMDAVRFVPGAPYDYQTDFTLQDYIKANL